MSVDNAPVDAAAPTLDPGSIARLRELDPGGRHGVVSRVLSTYDASLRRLLEQLDTARADAATVSAIAHTLKSSSASVGALRMAAACAEVEARLRVGDHAALQGDVDRLLAEGRSALRAVANMLQA